jgi:hypothetical protein
MPDQLKSSFIFYRFILVHNRIINVGKALSVQSFDWTSLPLAGEKDIEINQSKSKHPLAGGCQNYSIRNV